MKKHRIKCDHAKEIAAQMSRQIPIPPPEQVALETHILECSNCEVDIQLSRLMQKDSVLPHNELADRRRVEWAITCARQSTAPPKACDTTPPLMEQKRFQVVLAAAALLLGAGLIALYLGTQSRTPIQLAATTTTGSNWQNGTRIHLPTPDIHDVPDISAFSSSETNALGLSGADALGSHGERTFLSMAPGIDVALEAGSSVSILSSSANQFRIRLEKGQLLASVNPNIPHPQFIVETSKGTVVVKGTIFSVSVQRRTRVEVLRGKVSVARNGNKNFVTKGSGFEFDSQTVYVVSSVQKETLQHRLSLLETNHKNKLNEPETPADSTVETSLLVPSSNTQKATKKTEQKIPLRATLILARQKKSARDWAGALEAYEQIIAAYPSSNEAATARITAGNLRLKFGDAVGALSHFNGYLKTHNAPLKEEALLGKIKSLRVLNDEPAELNAMKQFVAMFPQSLHSATMTKRITILELME